MGPEGWRHRLALIEAADLSWFVGDRIGPDRPALWMALRMSGVQDDAAALARVGWAMRRLDDVEAWAARSEAEMTLLSGRTPLALRAALTEWPLVSAPMAEVLTGTSRTAVQRNLAWMEARHLIREVTGQGRYRMWRIVDAREIESRSSSNRSAKVSPNSHSKRWPDKSAQLY